jgi:hypothetical protein
VSAAVSPAKSATFPIGSIVVQSVAKSLLILINRGDMSKCALSFYTNDDSTASESCRQRLAIKRLE